MSPFLILISTIIFLAAINFTIGVRRAYVKLLLKIFEYGRQNIETAKRRTRRGCDYDDDDIIDDENNVNINNENNLNTEINSNELNNKESHQLNKKLSNGNAIALKKDTSSSSLSTVQSETEILKPASSTLSIHSNSSNSLISRDTLILLPDGDTKQNNVNNSGNINNNNGSSSSSNNGDGSNKIKDSEDKDSTNNDEFSFELSNCLDYVKAGVEAIIEDEVTSRFEAEELKNWNLLTRTNRHYEFISWRLSVIWMIGFVIRYCILMPLRVLICFIGLCFAIISMTLVSLIPNEKIRIFFADISYKLMFRILIRSVSAVLTFHNKQYRPKNNGFCVANHTTPMDIAVLSTETRFCLVIWLTICTAVVGCIPDGDAKRRMVEKVSYHCFGVLSSAISAVVNYHNIENRPKKGICVANHTSPIDVLVLMCDNTYSLIGQRHGGFLGILQRALARASPHIWFERAEAKDRHTVAERLKEHVSDPKNPPILIFPEGTCINNTSVMQFKKGSFEVDGTIYPVAIKYDPRFGDAFWNSSRYSMLQYLYMMMTSWAIVCDVWYLPPMYRKDGESAIDFANRVKSVIAKQGGLVDLVWDGQLKRMKPKKEWKEKQQIEFTKRLKNE